MDNDQVLTPPIPDNAVVTNQSTVTVPLSDEELANRIENDPKKHRAGFDVHPENINRKGRPKREWTWRGILEDMAEEDHTFRDKKGKKIVMQWKKAIAKKLYQAANSGNIYAIKEIMNRMDGMPVQDITSGGEKLASPLPYIPRKDNE